MNKYLFQALEYIIAFVAGLVLFMLCLGIGSYAKSMDVSQFIGSTLSNLRTTWPSDIDMPNLKLATYLSLGVAVFTVVVLLISKSSMYFVEKNIEETKDTTE